MSTINGCIVFNELMCYNLTTAITKKKKGQGCPYKHLQE